MARKAFKFQVRKDASKIIQKTIFEQMFLDSTQNINDLWRCVTGRLDGKVNSSTATIREFFHKQIMKFFIAHRYVKTKQTWVRRRPGRGSNGTTEKMRQFLETKRMKFEDMLSGPL